MKDLGLFALLCLGWAGAALVVLGVFAGLTRMKTPQPKALTEQQRWAKDWNDIPKGGI